MTSELLTYERLHGSSHGRAQATYPLADNPGSGKTGVSRLDQEDYRSFVSERRMPAKDSKDKVLVKWLIERKNAGYELA